MYYDAVTKYPLLLQYTQKNRKTVLVSWTTKSLEALLTERSLLAQVLLFLDSTTSELRLGRLSFTVCRFFLIQQTIMVYSGLTTQKHQSWYLQSA